MTKFRIAYIIVVALSLIACDRTIPIEIKNISIDTVAIEAETTIKYQCDDSLIDFKEYPVNIESSIIKFKLAPNTKVTCGIAIMGLEKDLPFKKFKIYTKNDSIVANSREEVLNLFEKTHKGKYKIPFELIVR